MVEEELKKIVYEMAESQKWIKGTLEEIKEFIKSCDNRFASKDMEIRLNSLIWGIIGFIVLGVVGFFFIPKASAVVHYLSYIINIS